MISKNTSRRFDLFGGNASAYKSREPEVLLFGGAGGGKTAAWLLKVLTLCDKYPGSRCLIVRKTRASLTESVLVTWENKILGLDHPMLTRRPVYRHVRQNYFFPNGSEVAVGGMDKPDKFLSSEWDFIYAPEATDFELGQWEQLGSRLRSGPVPFRQLAGCCNPTTPHHFLHQRSEAGSLAMYSSRLQDNPYFWNRQTQSWTPDGADYYRRLQTMSGTRRKRFLEGVWSVAEGLVYDYHPQPEYDDEGKVLHPGHDLPPGWKPPHSWARVWAIDWGKRSPSVLQLWAIDDEGRMYLYREVFKTRLRPDLLGEWARMEIDSAREKEPYAIVCDHDEESKRLFEQSSRLVLSNADKVDRDKGIEEMQRRFDLQSDNRPRIFFSPTAREHEPDELLVQEGRPSSTIAELGAYVYDKKFVKDEPIAENDHGMDAARYACRFVSSQFANPYSDGAGVYSGND